MESKITLVSSQTLETSYGKVSGIAEFLQDEGQAVLYVGYKAGTAADTLQVRVDTSSDKTLFFGECVQQSSASQTTLSSHEYTFTDIAAGANRRMFGDVLGVLEAVDNDEVQTYTSNLQRLKFVLPPVTGTTPVIRHNNTAFGTVTEKANVAAFTAPGVLAAGTVEWALTTGELNFSNADLVSYVGQEIRADWATNYNLFTIPVNVQDKFIKVGLKNVAAGGAGTGFCYLTFTSKAGSSHVSPVINVSLSDLQIGAVELKDSTTDARADVKVANTARTTGTIVVATQSVDEAGLVLGRDAANTARTTATKVNPMQHIGANGSPLPSGVLADPIYVKDTTSGSDIVVLNATGAVALNTTTAVAAEFKLLKILVHFSAAPTTSENLVIKLDSIAGVAYDTTLFSTNPSLSAATDIAYLVEDGLKFKTGDEIVVTFTNTDTRTYGLSIYYQLI